jgi:isoleucyl-tRNA synthetase
LDVIKDRQYTTQENSLARRSAQTAMFHIIRAMVRWMSPILSFTADELWAHIPGEKEELVFLSQWYQGLEKLADDEQLGEAYWQKALAVKTAVNKVLEAKRSEGVVGGSLQAEVTLYCNDELAELLQRLGDELRFVLITSTAVIKPLAESNNAVSSDVDGLEISVTQSEHAKCERCWHHREDVGANDEHKDLCGRCIENLDGAGEQRLFA